MSKKDVTYCKESQIGLQICMAKTLERVRPNNSLLNSPLCLLTLQIKGSLAEECIQIVREELKAKGINFHFHFWISDDWFCADGIPGIALPFYLFNKEISKLEKERIGFIEGSTKIECLKLIRHEVGHAIDNAYDLRSCQEREILFGSSTLKYPKEYIRKPFSKSYVKHIRENYAQAHPDEDWAETFAVWLDPKSNWKEKYKNWKALEKLNYVDRTMKSIKGKRPRLKNKDTVDEISTLGITLRTYLNRKAKIKSKYKAPIFGKNLSKVFSPGRKNNALKFIALNESELCIRVAKNTNQYHYIVRDVLKELKGECRDKSLTLKMPISQTRETLIQLLSKSTLHYVKQGKNKVIM